MGKDDGLTWFPWHPDKWRASRKVAKMNAAERGIYRELLDECWLEGSIPSDMGELADIARVSPDEMSAAWPVLKACFSERPDGRWVNDKIARVHLAQLEVLARRQESGRKGGLSTQAKLKQALSTPKAIKREIDISLNSRAGTLEATPPLPANRVQQDVGTARTIHGQPFDPAPPPCPHCDATLDDSGKRIILVHEHSCPAK